MFKAFQTNWRSIFVSIMSLGRTQFSVRNSDLSQEWLIWESRTQLLINPSQFISISSKAIVLSFTSVFSLRILISSLRFYNLLQVKLRNLLTSRTPHEGSRESFGDGVVSWPCRLIRSQFLLLNTQYQLSLNRSRCNSMNSRWMYSKLVITCKLNRVWFWEVLIVNTIPLYGECWIFFNHNQLFLL